MRRADCPRRIEWLSLLAIIAIIFLASESIASAEPKRVLILHSFGRDFRPWSEYARVIRAELDRQSPWSLDLQEHSLITARFVDEDPEAAFVDYLQKLYAKHPLDLIVSIGAPAARFVQNYRQRLFPETPMILTAVEQRRVQKSLLGEKDVVVAVQNDFTAFIENILRVLPDTKTIAVINGASPIEKFWAEEIRKEVKPLENRVSLLWFSNLPFDEILKNAAALPPNSAIFWQLMLVDAAGVAHEGDSALRRLHAVANAPIFSYEGGYFGNYTVGGPMHLPLEVSRQTAAVAVRILGGEKPSDVKVPPLTFRPPRFDWREMQRWGISEKNLPPGSEIEFRVPTVWEQYRWQILLISSIILVQTALILGLLHEHRRRRRAEVESLRRMAELAHLNRVATAGELSASIAHEVKQPLAAMAAQSGAALRWLAQNSPNLTEARVALEKIKIASDRASQIVENLRSMFRKELSARKPLNINVLIENVLALASHEIQKNSISVQTSLFDEAEPKTLGDQAQLEQVFLNLIMNAIEAMSSSGGPRFLRIKTSVSEDEGVLVTVADSGPGIDAKSFEKIFDAFYTTKPSGMGMGLPICRSIIESHGGRLRAEHGDSGLIFLVSLPVAD